MAEANVSVGSSDVRPEQLVAMLGRSLDSWQRAWALCAVRAAAAGAEAVRGLLGTARGRVVVGKGAGGDATVLLDEVAENAILSELGLSAPEAFNLVTEEAGIRADAGGAEWWVVVDPVDGSLNAKRGLEPSCIAVAVARGGVLQDVQIGYVRDLARDHSYLAVVGAGFVSTRVLEPVSPEAPVELMLLEAGRPSRHEFAFRDLSLLGGTRATGELRVRTIGSVALSLCQVALGVSDLLVAPVSSRSVDIAAGLLMVRESGGGAGSLDGSSLFEQPLDLERRAPLVAWRRGMHGDEVLARARRLISR